MVRWRSAWRKDCDFVAIPLSGCKGALHYAPWVVFPDSCQRSSCNHGLRFLLGVIEFAAAIRREGDSKACFWSFRCKSCCDYCTKRCWCFRFSTECGACCKPRWLVMICASTVWSGFYVSLSFLNGQGCLTWLFFCATSVFFPAVLLALCSHIGDCRVLGGLSHSVDEQKECDEVCFFFLKDGWGC